MQNETEKPDHAGQKRSLPSTTPAAAAAAADTPSTDKDTNTHETNANKKQHVQSESQQEHTIQIPIPNNPCIIDIAETLNLQPGARIEVQWDLHFDHLDHDDDDDDAPPPHEKQTRWWGGTLLQPDSRTHTLQDDHDDESPSSSATAVAISPSKQDAVTVPIRVIDYDAYIEGGFLDRSLEDVCFLSDHSLLNVDSDARAYWRKEGEDWEPSLGMDEEERKLMAMPRFDGAAAVAAAGVAGGAAAAAAYQSDDDISVASTSREDALRVVLDTVLQSAMQKAGVMGKMSKLEASQRSVMAEKIARVREKLTEKLMEQLNRDDADADAAGNNGGNSLDNDQGLEKVITKEHVAKVMQELQKDL